MGLMAIGGKGTGGGGDGSDVGIDGESYRTIEQACVGKLGKRVEGGERRSWIYTAS